MDLPSLLPQKFSDVKDIQDDRLLIERLGKNAEDFIAFFEYAVGDETWCDNHREYTRLAILWMTNLFFEDKLDLDTARRAVNAIRDHYYSLDKVIPKNLTIKFDDSQSEENSMLWGVSGRFLRELIRKECRDAGETVLVLEDLSPIVFHEIKQYIHAGGTGRLTQKGDEEVIAVLKKADEWQIEELKQGCQEILVRFINRGNALEFLLLAHEHRWKIFMDGCIDFLNTLDLGVRFEKMEPQYLAVRFLRFSQDVMQLFEQLRYSITHLICGEDLTEQTGFSEVVARSPNMVCLDLSTSYSFTTRLYDIPESLKELDISKCEWLSDRTFKRIITICPNLEKISMGNNLQLHFSCWRMLKELSYLSKIDITRSLQVKDDDFKIILQACRDVTHFYLEECTGLSDNAFYELALAVPNLTDLDVSRCNISDGGLIDLATRCRQLTVLKVSRCPNLTDKGVYEAVRNLPSLKNIDISRCPFVGKPVLEKIRAIRPYLEVIY